MHPTKGKAPCRAPPVGRGREDSTLNGVTLRVAGPFLMLKETTRFLYSFIDALESSRGPF